MAAVPLSKAPNPQLPLRLLWVCCTLIWRKHGQICGIFLEGYERTGEGKVVGLVEEEKLSKGLMDQDSVELDEFVLCGVVNTE